MINSINSSSNSLFNFSSIGRVSEYAKNLVDSYLKNNESGSTGSITSGFLNSFASGTIANTVQNNFLFSKQNQTNLIMLKSTANSLSSAAKMLTTGTGSLISADNSIVSAKGRTYSSANLSFDITVNSLASKQESVSAKFDSGAASAFGKGINKLTINTEKGGFNIAFNVEEGDSNLDSLNALANSINSSRAGVSASVVSENGESTLKITSKETGRESAFEIGGDAAKTLGMTTKEEASDASYSVNGTSYTSNTNTVNIPGGRGATMTLEGTGSTTVGKGIDASALVSAAKSFASAYNKTVGHLVSGNADGAGVEKALNLVADNKMTSMSIGKYGGYAAARLSSMGISIDQDGLMQIDEEKLTSAAQNSPISVREAIAGYGGLATGTSENASEAMRIPAATYTDFSNMGTQSSLLSMFLPNTGSLFDFYL